MNRSADLNAERRRLRRRRLEIPRDERRRADRRIEARLFAAGLIRPRSAVAVYVAVRGEVSLERAIERGRRIGATFYAPRILNLPRRTMAFMPLEARGRLRRNWYGLLEPTSRRRANVYRDIDVVMLPLLGFDRRGYRLGMGAGFYDRALSRRRGARRATWRRPLLVGIAYGCQEISGIAPAPWDVLLDFVATEKELIDCRRNRAPKGTNP
jgi:5-formyltetrahydrofolate cyclo-ligase